MAKQGLGRLIQQLKSDDWLGRLIDGHHERAEPERWSDPDVTIHPSGAGSQCAREIELGMLGHRSATPARNRRRMDNGTWAHNRWNEYLKDVGVLKVHSLRKRYVDPIWSGELDVIVENPITGAEHIGELKTMNAARWKRVPKQVTDRYEMAKIMLKTERRYVYQLAQYYARIGRERGVDRECFFLFENTDTQEFKVIYVAFTDELIAEAFANSKAAQEAALRGELIEAPFSKRSPICRGCYHEKLCYNIQDGDEGALMWLQGALKQAVGR